MEAATARTGSRQPAAAPAVTAASPARQIQRAVIRAPSSHSQPGFGSASRE